MMMATYERKAFISYCSEDRGYAYRVRDAAVALKFSFFFDEEDLYPGSIFPDEIQKAVDSVDLFIAVLTPNWAKAHWPKSELDAYYRSCERRSTHAMVIPLEFRTDTSSFSGPIQIGVTSVVRGAAALSHAELCWLLYCGAEKMRPGPSRDWDAQGLQLIERLNTTESREGLEPLSQSEPDPKRKESSISHRELEDKLLAKVKSDNRIREISREVFGYVPDNLSENPRSAWYKIIKLAHKKDLVGRLLSVSGLDSSTVT